MREPAQLTLISDSPGAEAPLGVSVAPLAVSERPGARVPTLRGRGALLLVILSLWLGAMVWRLYELQIQRHESYLERAQSQQLRTVELEAPRGTIFDAAGRKLAVSVKAESVFVDPSQVEDVERVATSLARALDLEPKLLAARIAAGKEFVWIERKLDPRVAQKVRDLDLAGVHFLEESRRRYPNGQLGAQLLGFVGTDQQGLEGLESEYNEPIAGRSVPRSVLRDGTRAWLVPPTALEEEAVAGVDLHLTLDGTLQYLAETELERAVRERGAVAGTVLLLDARDSAILAMASYPTFDPNDFSASPPEHRRNRAVMDAYEPGSTLKMVTAAAVLDSLAVHPDDRFDCEMGSVGLGRTRIRDHKPFGVLSFREVIARSSNVGVIKAALRAGPGQLQAKVSSFGFGRLTGVDLPGESPGIVRSAEWDELEMAYAAFGHGLSTSHLQLANAYAALANGGWLNTPYIVRAFGRAGVLEELERPPPSQLDLSPATQQEVIRLLEGVVEGGTGRAAGIEGYRVAGKTGTAEKSDRTGYSETGRIASFVGIVPSRRPRLVGLVAIDEPHGVTGGGAVAAPVFARVMERALLHLGVPPEIEEWQDRSRFITLAPDSGPRTAPTALPTASPPPVAGEAAARVAKVVALPVPELPAGLQEGG